MNFGLAWEIEKLEGKLVSTLRFQTSSTKIGEWYLLMDETFFIPIFDNIENQIPWMCIHQIEEELLNN